MNKKFPTFIAGTNGPEGAIALSEKIISFSIGLNSFYQFKV
jgi:hypothetical protein